MKNLVRKCESGRVQEELSQSNHTTGYISHFFLLMACGMCCLSSPMRDCTCALCNGSVEF